MLAVISTYEYNRPWRSLILISVNTTVYRMAAQQSQGIQTLLEAEKEASKIVQQARQYRVQKLKDARTEATKEIEAYKRAKEQEFRAFEASHAGTTSTTQVALDKDTDVKLKEIDAVFKRKKDDVVNSLLARATLVHPELHRNLKKLNA
ncbi:V-type ATPase [Phlegmacium glaucopus]|nr:V-type ATPase [Phlegmacium glaucopus]